MATIRPIPHPLVAMVDSEGRITPPWFEYFKNLGLSGLADVKITALANGQVLTWNAADGKWENGAN